MTESRNRQLENRKDSAEMEMVCETLFDLQIVIDTCDLLKHLRLINVESHATNDIYSAQITKLLDGGG